MMVFDMNDRGDGVMKLVGSRPNHPGMLDAEDLTPGLLIHTHAKSGPPGLCRVLAEPEDGWVRVASLAAVRLIGEVELLRSLADMGMIPYEPHDLWNPTNYATRADQDVAS